MTLNTTSITPAKLMEVLQPLFLEKLPAFLHGSVGLGKSSIIKQLADKNNLKLIDVRLSQIEAADLKGLPYIDVETKKTVWFTPEFLPTEESIAAEGYAGAILFLDELNVCEPRIQAASYELLLDRRVGSYNLPDNVWVVAAGNSVEDSTLVYEMGAAIADRVIHFKVVSNPTEWIKWGQANGIHPAVLTFIQVKPDYLDAGSISEIATSSGNRGGNSSDKLIVPTPRSWQRVSQMMHRNDGKNILEYIIPGIVGAVAAAEFFYVNEELEGLPPIETILNANDDELRRILPSKLSPMCGLV